MSDHDGQVRMPDPDAVIQALAIGTTGADSPLLTHEPVLGGCGALAGTRRSFLKMAGTAAAGLAGGISLPLAAPASPSWAAPAGYGASIPLEASSAVSVRSFGAIGDGSTDDTAAINAAIQATPAGATTLIPAGIFMC